MPEGSGRPDSYRYDAFISYSHFDKEWVYNWLLPRLKDAGLRICIDTESQEFDLGIPVTRAISDAIANSRFTVAILTAAFLDSEWGRIEDDFSRFKSISERRYPLIPVQLKNCVLPPSFKYLIYLDLTSEQEWDDRLPRLIRRIRGSGPAEADAPLPPIRQRPASEDYNFDVVGQHAADQHSYCVEARPWFSKAVVSSRMEWSEAETLTLAAEVKNGLGDRQLLKTLGKSLHDAIFAEPVRKLWDKSQRLVSRDGVMRLRLKLLAPNLCALPWELLYQDNYFITTARQHPIVRYSRESVRNPFEEQDEPFNILVTFASPDDQDTLQCAADEARVIEEKLTELRRDNAVGAIRLLNNVTPGKLREALREGFHVLHFIGHGTVINGRANLIFEDERGKSKPVDGESLFYLLRNTPLRLVVLNACQSAAPSQIDPLFGAAQGALESGVPAIVAMLGRISDRASVAFSRAFYQKLAEAGSIEESVNEGRLCIMAEMGLDRPDWSFPALFNNAPGRLVFRAPVSVPASPSPTSVPQFVEHVGSAEGIRTRSASQPMRFAVGHNLPPLPVGAFIDRDEQLKALRSEIESDLTPSAVQLVGAPGVGRTAIALQTAHQCLRFSEENPADPRTFKGIAWLPAELHRDLNSLLSTLARLFDIKGLMEADADDRLIVLRRFLEGGRYLLVLDDLEEDSRRGLDALLGELRASKVVFISQETVKAQGFVLNVPALRADAARELLTAYSQERGVQVTSEDLEAIVHLSAGNPFVLRWAVNQLSGPGQSVESVKRTLEEAQGRPLVRRCLEESLSSLTASEQRLPGGARAAARARG